MHYKNEIPSKNASSVKPVSLYLQTRPFAPPTTEEEEPQMRSRSTESAADFSHPSGIYPSLLNASPSQPANTSIDNPSLQRKETDAVDKATAFKDKLRAKITNPLPMPRENRAGSLLKKPIQAKLNIGEPDDKYEKEADANAERVVQQINSPLREQKETDGENKATAFKDKLRAKITNPLPMPRENRGGSLLKKPIQAKLNIGEPDDKYEKEADANAERVVQQINSRSQEQYVQKQENVEEEDELQEARLEISPITKSGENIVAQKKSSDKQSPEFVDNHPASEIQKSIQRMKIRDVNKSSEVSVTTHGKHVAGTGEQAAIAKANYSDTTFITSDDILTSIVDSNTHNFKEEKGTASERFDFDADVTIYQWNKNEGVGKDKAVTRTIDGVDTSCEIGVKKGGDEKLKITHFMKN
jgi:uncharacterized protein (DUF427 family)